MRLFDILALGMASIFALCPVAVRGQPLDDTRHQRRQQAARILRTALRDSSDRGLSPRQRLDLYLSACSQASKVLGPASDLSARLSEAIQALTSAEGLTDDVERAVRPTIEDVADTLAFQPIIEAELPRGFPPPTPVGEIELKRYPAYRKAEAAAGDRSPFWTLFNHIKEEGIAMTAPVQMDFDASGPTDPAQRSMAFLYGDPEQGRTAAEGPVRVVDVASMTVLSVGVRGDRTRQKVLSARRRLMDWLGESSGRFEPDGEIRVMGYNSPFVPAARRYFEVQIPVREVSQPDAQSAPADC